jgi:hypothetical protein
MVRLFVVWLIGTLAPCSVSGAIMGTFPPQSRTPDQILRSVISYCEFRAGSSWRNLADPAQRYDRERWDWLDAAQLCQSARYADTRIAPVLPQLDCQPSPTPLEIRLQSFPRAQLAGALLSLEPALTDGRLLARLPRPKLARRLAHAIAVAGSAKDPMRNYPAKDGNGMTYEEIAAALDISRARVQQLEASALQKLRKRPQSVTLLMALSGELDRMRARRTPVQPDSDEKIA